MIVCRRATKSDASVCLALLQGANTQATDVPDVMFICEDTEEGRLLGMVGLQMDHPGMVVVAGYTVQPDVYADPEMRRAVAEDLRVFVHGWMAEKGCKAYVCGVSKRNTVVGGCFGMRTNRRGI